MRKKIGFSELKVTSLRVYEESLVKLDAPSLVKEIWYKSVVHSDWFDFEKECLVVFSLNTRLMSKGFFLISLGSLNETIAQPREVFKPLVATSAYGFIVVHNHPSGDPSPSEADRRMTRRLHELGEMMGIRLMDSVIIGDKEKMFSFRESGLI